MLNPIRPCSSAEWSRVSAAVRPRVRFSRVVKCAIQPCDRNLNFRRCIDSAGCIIVDVVFVDELFQEVTIIILEPVIRYFIRI